MDERIINVLKSVGLGKSEIDVYLDLLRSRMSTATEISKRTQQHRSNVYDALERLEQRGFITEVIESNKRFFEAKNPSTIMNYLNQKQSEIKDIIPLLEQITNKGVDSESTRISYGLTRVREIMYNVLELNDEIMIWGASRNMEKIIGEAFLKEIEKERVRKKISARVLFTEEFRELREISKKSRLRARHYNEGESNVVTIICKDTVFMILLNKQISITEIKNEAMAEWWKQQYEIIWKNSDMSTIWNEEVIQKLKSLWRRFKKRLKIWWNGIVV